MAGTGNWRPAGIHGGHSGHDRHAARCQSITYDTARRGQRLAAAVLLSFIWAHACAAGAGSDSDLAWKLTLGRYQYSNFGGTDLNLRWRGDGDSVWAGVYGDPIFGTQGRGGADASFQLTKYLQLQPSVQLATGGFLGGSANLQLGSDWYGLVGFGRTDARQYFNLNFDPNDARTLGFGHQIEHAISWYFVLIEDDRFRTGQRDWHFNVQIPSGASHATLDLLHKTGLSDAGRVSAWGFTANWDWPRWFLRAAYDPYQNFSAQSAWRLSTGTRF